MSIPKVEVKNILYATDLSENARYAFAYAVSLANLYGAKITFLHVLPEVPNILDATVIGYIDSARWEEIKQQHFHEATESLIGKRRDHYAIKEVLDQFCEDAKKESAVEQTCSGRASAGGRKLKRFPVSCVGFQRRRWPERRLI